MKNINMWALGVVALLIGGVFGAFTFPTEVVKEVPVNVTKEVIKEVPVNVTVTNEIPVADAELFLNQAISDIFDELGDDDDFLTSDGYLYDENEVTVSDIREWSYNWVDNDQYEVIVEAKFKFKTDDERASYEVRTYKVTYEDGEDPDVELL